MMGKRGYFISLIGLLILILGQSVSAHFVCGQVEDSGLNYSASWIKVSTYYSNYPSQKASCQVSPSDNKYCCDPLEITSQTWGIGKKMKAQINDKSSGFYSNEVELVISGEGFDVFPKLNLMEAINTNLENDILILNESSIKFNVTLGEGITNLSYRLYNPNGSDLIEVCSNCAYAEIEIENLSSGTNIINLISGGIPGTFEKNISLYNLDYYVVERKLICEDCEQNSVNSGELLEMNLIFNFSHNVSGVIYDYFPNEWTYLFSGGFFEEFSESHNRIGWYFEGNYLELNYTLIAPNDFITRSYEFFSEINGLKQDSDEINVYLFYNFLSLPKKVKDRLIPRQYSILNRFASPSNALILSTNQSFPKEIAIIPLSDIENVYLYANQGYSPEVHIARKNSHLKFFTNIPPERIDRIFLSFEVNKTKAKKNVSEINLFLLDGEWKQINYTLISEDEKSSIFMSEIDRTGYLELEVKYV